MITNRLILMLMVVLIVMQGISLFKQQASPTSFQITPKATQQLVRDAPQGTLMEMSGLPTKGNIGAKVVLAEFSDFECPYCTRHAKGTGVQLEDEFVKTGKVKLVFVNNPLPIHPNARMFATASICADQQNRFWEMHDMLLRDGPTSKADVLPFVKRLALDSVRFQKCFDNSPESDKKITSDIAIARKFNLTGTPAFAIGTLNGDAAIKVDKFIMGALPVDVFEKALNEELAKVQL